MTKVMKDTPPIKESISQETSCSPLSLQLSTSNDKDSLLFLDEVFTKKKDDYLGFIKSREKLPLILSFLENEQNTLYAKCKLLDLLYKLFKDYPYLMDVLSSCKSAEKNTIGVILVNLYLQYIFTPSNNENEKEMRGQTKEKVLQMLYLFVTNLDFSKDVYDTAYSYLSKGFRNELEGEITSLNMKEYLKLLKILFIYVSKDNHAITPPQLQKNYLFFSENTLIETIFDNPVLVKDKTFTCHMWIYLPLPNEILKEAKSCMTLFEIQSEKEMIMKVVCENNMVNVIASSNKKELPRGLRIPNDEWVHLTIVLQKGEFFILIDYVNIDGDKENFRIGNCKALEKISRIVLLENFIGYCTNIICFLANFPSLKNEKQNDNKQKEKHYKSHFYPFFPYGLENKKMLKEFSGSKNDNKNKSVNEVEFIENALFLYSPFHYNSRDQFFNDYINHYTGNLKTKSIMVNAHLVPKNYKHITNIGGFNQFLPILELIYTKSKNNKLLEEEFINEEVLYDYLDLVLNLIFKSKHNFNDAIYSNFFVSLSLFLEKFSDKMFNTKIINLFVSCFKSCFAQSLQYPLEDKSEEKKKKQVLSFIDNIVMNEKILLKFSFENQAKLINCIYNEIYLYPNDINNYLPFTKIQQIIRLNDKHRFEQFCCKHHSRMFNFDSKVLNNISSPEMIHTISFYENTIIKIMDQELINNVKEKELTKEEKEVTKEKYKNTLSFFNMLSLDLSPCTQIFIIKVFIHYFKNGKKEKNPEKQRELQIQLIKNKGIDIILYVLSVSLIDVKRKILKLFYYLVFHNFKEVEPLLEMNLTSIFQIIKQYIIPNNLQMDFCGKVSLSQSTLVLGEHTYSNILSKSDIKDIPKDVHKTTSLESIGSGHCKSNDAINTELRKINSMTSSIITESVELNVSEEDSQNIKDVNEDSDDSDEDDKKKEDKCNGANEIKSYFKVNKKDENSKYYLSLRIQALAKHCVEHIKIKKKNPNYKTYNDTQINTPNKLSFNPPQTSVDYADNTQIKNIQENQINTIVCSNEIGSSFQTPEIAAKEFEKIDEVPHTRKRLYYYFEKDIYNYHVSLLYKQIYYWLSNKTVNSNETFIFGVFELLLKIAYDSRHIYILQQFLEDIHTILNTKEEIKDSKESKESVNFYEQTVKWIYQSETFYQFIIETMFLSTMIINFKNYRIPFNNKLSLIELQEIAHQLYFITRTLHKDLFVLPKDLLINSKAKNKKKKKDNKEMIPTKPPTNYLDKLLSWGIYEKLIYEYSEVKKKSEINSVMILIDNFIRLLLEDCIEYYQNVSLINEEIEENNFIQFSSILYEYILIYNTSKNIKDSNSALLSPQYNGSMNFYCPDFISSSLRFILNPQKKTISTMWSDFELINNYFTSIENIWSFTKLSEKYSNIIIKSEDDKMYVLNKIIDQFIDRKASNKFEKEINLFFTNSRGYHFELSFLKIISNLLTTTISIIQDQTECDQWLLKYEHFLTFLIIASTVQYRKATENQIKNRSQINQIILFGFAFLLDKIYIDKPSYIHFYKRTLKWITYITINILNISTNIDSKTGIRSSKKNYIECPIIKLFVDIIKVDDKNIFEYETLLTNPKKSILLIDQYYDTIFPIWKDKVLENEEVTNELKLVFDKESFQKKCKIRYEEIANYIPLFDKNDVSSIKEEGVKKFNLKLTNNYIEKEAIEERKKLIESINNTIKAYNVTMLKVQKENSTLYKTKKATYRKVKKKLFSWNSPWSDKTVFYKEKGKLREKLIVHYTKEFAMPILAPILDIEYYLPKFSLFDSQTLFLKNKNNCGYRINLDIEEVLRKDNIEKEKENSSENYLLNIYRYINNGEMWSMYNKLRKEEEDEMSFEKYSNLEPMKTYYKCCMVKQTHHVVGKIELGEKSVEFTLRKLTGEDEDDKLYDTDRKTCSGSIFISHYKDRDFVNLKIVYSKISFVLVRKYFYRNSALEVYTLENKSYYFNFNTQDERDKVLKELRKKVKGEDIKVQNKEDNVIGFINEKMKKLSSLNIFTYFTKINDVIEKWKSNQISNYEMLMWANILGNRSYRDLFQYPVFPWPIQNFSTDKLKITVKDNNEEVKVYPQNLFRNLALPMGMLDFDEAARDRKELYKQFLENMLKEGSDDFDVNGSPYCYGSHFSNPMYVSHYLVRIFPYSLVQIEMQGSKFDDPHRLFLSVENSWKCAASQKCDIRELTPEFFCLSEMYYNINNLDMSLQNPDVELPKFSKNKGYELTKKIRKILEYKEFNVNNWIDLIFGYLQRGKKAEEHYNVYMSYAYDGNINLDKIEDKGEIKCNLRLFELGVMPTQIVLEPISGRTEANADLDILVFEKKEKNLLTKTFTKLGDSFPIALYNIEKFYHIVVLNNYTRINLEIRNTNFSDFSFNETNVVKYLPSDSHLHHKINNFYQKNESNVILARYKKTPIALYQKGDVIAQGGYWGGEIIVTQISKKITKIVKSVFSKKPVVCLVIDKAELYAISGDTGGQIVIYFNLSKIEWQFKMAINDHKDEITSIFVDNHLNAVGTASYDGYIMIYTLGKFKLVRSIKVWNEDPLNKFTYADNIFLSDCPLPCIVIYNQEVNKYQSYTINGTPIDISKSKKKKGSNLYMQSIPKIKQKKKLTSYCVFKDRKNYNDYLFAGYSDGTIQLRTFPAMKKKQKFKVFDNKPIRLMELSLKRATIALMVWTEGNEYKFIHFLDYSFTILPQND